MMIAGYRVLIVEAEPNLRTIFALFVQHCYPRAHVCSVTTGMQALDSYAQDGADLLIINSTLPHIAGATVIHTLRMRGVTIPMLGLAADPANAWKIQQAGATSALTLPCNFAELQHTIDALVCGDRPPHLHPAPPDDPRALLHT